MRQGTDRHTQMVTANIHCTLAMPHAPRKGKARIGPIISGLHTISPSKYQEMAHRPPCVHSLVSLQCKSTRFPMFVPLRALDDFCPKTCTSTTNLYVLFWINCWKELAKPGSPGKYVLKWRRWENFNCFGHSKTYYVEAE